MYIYIHTSTHTYLHPYIPTHTHTHTQTHSHPHTEHPANTEGLELALKCLLRHHLLQRHGLEELVQQHLYVYM